MVKILKENDNINRIPLECIKGATLLSEKEAKNLLTQEERKCKGTQKAKNNGLYIDPHGYSNYWLRSKGDDYSSVCFVMSDGYISNDCSIHDMDIGIRPALIIDLQPSNLKIGDSFEFGDYTFKIISNNLALCNVIIDAYCFNHRGNDYETSQVKLRIDNWFYKSYKDIECKEYGTETDDELFDAKGMTGW